MLSSDFSFHDYSPAYTSYKFSSFLSFGILVCYVVLQVESRSVYRRNPDSSSDFVSSDRSIEFHRTLKGEKICSHSRSKIVTQNASVKLIKNKNPRFLGVRIIWVPMFFVMLVLLFFFFLWASSARKVYKSHCQPT